MGKSTFLVSLLFVLIAQPLFAQENASDILGKAYVQAKEENKNVFLIFHASWCGWCKKMDAFTFQDPKLIEYINDQFYAVKLNAENTNRTFEFMGKKYSEAQMAAAMRVQSFPNFVIIDPTLKNITQLPGYREPDQFLEGLGYIVKKGFRGQ